MRVSSRIRRGQAIGCATGQGMSGRLIGYLRRCGRNVSRFRRAPNAATAVEFALVAPALIATLIAILEVMYFLFAQQTLQTAAVEFGRQFMTNQGPAQGSTINKVNGNYNGQLLNTSSICNIIKTLLDCTQVTVSVTPYDTYAGADTSTLQLYDGSGNPITSFNYTAGTPGQIVVIKLAYQLTTITGPLGFVLKSLTNGKMEVMGITAIRVEPS
jgi:Flp pilus assembly protein TadG